MAAGTSSSSGSPKRRQPLTPHDWKVLGAFGLLAGALAMYDAKLALYMIGVASAVVVVKNANYIEGMLP